jgi:hypothetical protein
MSHHTIRDKERLAKLSEGQCDLNDVQGIIDRVVDVSVMALNGSAAASRVTPRAAASSARAS